MYSNVVPLLHRANQLATEAFAEAIGEHDLTSRQVQVLAAIAKNPGKSQITIVEATGIDRSTLAEMTRRLVWRKLVTRKRSKDDARAYMLNLTSEGNEMLAKGLPAMTDVSLKLLQPLTIKQRTQLLTLLEKIVQDR